jgi:hypothetical protein
MKVKSINNNSALGELINKACQIFQKRIDTSFFAWSLDQYDNRTMPKEKFMELSSTKGCADLERTAREELRFIDDYYEFASSKAQELIREFKTVIPHIGMFCEIMTKVW